LKARGLDWSMCASARVRGHVCTNGDKGKERPTKESQTGGYHTMTHVLSFLIPCYVACLLVVWPCLLLLLLLVVLLLVVLLLVVLLFFLFYGGSWVDLAACCCSPLPISLSLSLLDHKWGGREWGRPNLHTRVLFSILEAFSGAQGRSALPPGPRAPKSKSKKTEKKLTSFLSPRFASLRALYSLPRHEEKGSQFQSPPVMPQSPPTHLHTPHTAGSRCCCCCSCPCCCCSCSYKSFYLALTQSTLF